MSLLKRAVDTLQYLVIFLVQSFESAANLKKYKKGRVRPSIIIDVIQMECDGEHNHSKDTF